MPDHIVREYASIFEQRVAPALKKIRTQAISFEAIDIDGVGFGNHHITITSEAPTPAGPHSYIWAANNVQILKNNFGEGVIVLNPEAANAPSRLLTVILAHEWIEVMLAFRDRRSDKRVNGKEDLIFLYRDLGRRTLWEDSESFEAPMKRAIEDLLVSEAAVSDVLNSCYEGLDLPGLFHKLTAGEPMFAPGILLDVANTVSQKLDVDIETVNMRLQDILFGLDLNHDSNGGV